MKRTSNVFKIRYKGNNITTPVYNKFIYKVKRIVKLILKEEQSTLNKRLSVLFKNDKKIRSTLSILAKTLRNVDTTFSRHKSEINNLIKYIDKLFPEENSIQPNMNLSSIDKDNQPIILTRTKNGIRNALNSFKIFKENTVFGLLLQSILFFTLVTALIGQWIEKIIDRFYNEDDSWFNKTKKMILKYYKQVLLGSLLIGGFLIFYKYGLFKWSVLILSNYNRFFWTKITLLFRYFFNIRKTFLDKK